MSYDLSLHRINLLESFENMLHCIRAFCLAVQIDHPLSAWVSRTDAEIGANVNVRDKAAQLYQALWYEDGQDGRETLTCPGIIGASPDTLAAADECNQAKDAFKAAVLALKDLRKADANALLEDLQRRDETVASAMARMGAARLNLKQAYRRIPRLDRKPLKIGFTWSKQGRAIERTSVAEARRLLERRTETPQIRLELQRLASIPETEVLARIRSIRPHLRANLVFPATDSEGNETRRLMQAPLPILIPLQPGERLPEFVPISPEPSGQARLQRSDVRIEEDPFLPSIRVHRYRLAYR